MRFCSMLRLRGSMISLLEFYACVCRSATLTRRLDMKEKEKRGGALEY
jgi:hypothetical protein